MVKMKQLQLQICNSKIGSRQCLLDDQLLWGWTYVPIRMCKSDPPGIYTGANASRFDLPFHLVFMVLPGAKVTIKYFQGANASRFAFSPGVYGSTWCKRNNWVFQGANASQFDLH